MSPCPAATHSRAPAEAPPQCMTSAGQCGSSCLNASWPVSLRDPAPSLHCLYVVIRSLHGALRHLDLGARHRLVGDEAQQMADAVEPRMLLGIRAHDVPGRPWRVGGVEHLVSRQRVVVPAPPRFQVGRAQLPLPQRVVDAGPEASLLLLVVDLEPELDQPDSVARQDLLEGGAKLQELAVLVLRAEAEHPLDARAVVVAPVEDDDLAGRGEMRQIALDVELRLLAVGGRGQRDNAEDPRAAAFRDRPDGAALARCVTALENDDDPLPGGLDPVLEMAELGLKAP